MLNNYYHENILETLLKALEAKREISTKVLPRKNKSTNEDKNNKI